MIAHTAELEKEIAEQHDALGENLAELESQAAALVDWKARVRKNPMMMLGLAFAGGVMIAAVARSRRGPRRARNLPSTDGQAEPDDETETVESTAAPAEAREAWDNVKAALLGAAASKLVSLVGDALRDEGTETDDDEETETERTPRRKSPRRRAVQRQAVTFDEALAPDA